MKNNPAIGITGTPATGKRTVATILAEKLNAHLVDLNRLILGRRLMGDAETANPPLALRRSRKAVAEALRSRPVVIFGHLLPYVTLAESVDLVVVLRCSPHTLLGRYAERGYSPSKARANAGAEILDLLLADALRNFGRDRVAEIDVTNSTPQAAVTQIVAMLKGDAPLR